MPLRPRARNRWRRSAMLCGVLLWGVGCGGESPPPVPESPPATELRLVTLAPALTQMAVDLGRADRLVGVTDKDTAAPEGVTVVGNFVELDTERLLTVRPTHVLQMVPAHSGVSPGLMSMAAAAGFEVVGYPYPYTIGDVLDTLDGGRDGVPGLGEVLGTPDRAATLRDAMERFFRDLEAATGAGPRPRVLLAIGTNPIMASGPGSVNDELLRHAGGTNAAATATVSAPTYDREGLVAINPQVVLILSPGRQSVDARAMALLAPELEALPIDAVRDGRVVLINDPATLLPSTSLPRIAAIMARAIHPGRAAEIDRLWDAYERVLKEVRGEPVDG